MSVKKTNETTSSKILNSDIYDITRFVDDIKKKNIDGIDSSKETLLVGMYGYLGYQFASLLQNAIVTSSELSNEAIPTRAKFDRNVITHALSLGIKKVAATAPNMKVLIMFPEKALRANMIDGKFVLKSTTPLNFNEFEFHTDYDIEINYVNLKDSTNGSKRDYVYTAKYIMDYDNPISDIDNPFLPPVAIFNYVQDNMIAIATTIHQVYYREINEKILSSDVIANKTISFSFDKQMSHFIVECQEPSASESGDGKLVTMIPVYDGLYNQEIAQQAYCYYQYINPNTIRIRFDPTNYQPPANSDITINLYTTDGNSGNFQYSEDITIRLTSNEYTNLYCIITQRGEDGSSGGLDRQTIEELQHIIPKEALSRGSITTLTDLRNFFNSLNNENSVLHVFRKEDNILDRIYYVYNLMKDSEHNIVPTNTIPVFLEGSRRDSTNGKIYLESGTPIFYYKYGDGVSAGLLKNNYIGYLEQKVSNTHTNYCFYNGEGYTTYQGTPTKETLQKWYNNVNYRYSFDPNISMGSDYVLEKPKPESSYDFFKYSTVYFKPFWDDKLTSRIYPSPQSDEDAEELYNRWFYGTCTNCKLVKFNGTYRLSNVLNDIKNAINNEGIHVCNHEIEFVDGSITTHYPKRITDTIDPVTRGYVSEVKHGSELYSIEINDYNKINAIRFFRPRTVNKNGTLTVGDECMFDFDIEYILDVEGRRIGIQYLDLYMWLVQISFYDETERFHDITYEGGKTAIRWFYVPDYIYDLSTLDTFNKKAFIIDYISYFYQCLSDTDRLGNYLVLDTINTIDVYSYSGQDEYSFNNLTLSEGDLIRFDTYRGKYGTTEDSRFIYQNPSSWTLGEVLSMTKNNGRITSIEILTKNEEVGDFTSTRYKIPVPNANEDELDDSCILLISKMSKFLYTNPLSMILEDDPSVNTHRITASYYLDIINETRFQEYECINSKSPIQFILTSIHTYRSSYLSDNRYKYTIQINIKPNTGVVDTAMVNRTQVIGVFYKKNSEETIESKPIMYSIAKHKPVTKSYIDDEGNEVLEDVIADDDGIHYEITLYTRPFTTSDKSDRNTTNYRVDIIDDENNVYMGSKQIISEIKAMYPEDDESAKEEFFKRYKMFNTDANNPRPLSINDLPEDFTLDNISKCGAYVDTIYMNLNTELKIYILYKYNDNNVSNYTDNLTKQYLSLDMSNTDALYNSVSQYTKFTQVIPLESNNDDYTPDYILKDMVLTNVYNTYKGINLLYDYSNVMNSYVSAMKTNDIFSIDNNNMIEAYIANRVPCVRYFYWNTEERVLTFIKDMKSKINYVTDAIAPLECTFGLDYKFFNTYGPSNMYHITDDDGDLSELIDNVALTVTFKAKFYNEDSDADSIIEPIKNTIKEYLEKLDQLDDIHFPNITTLIETEYSEYLIYFEFVSFNIYTANEQHVITNEDMEMLSMVPEFLHIDTNDLTGRPYINIRIVTT